MRTTKVTIRANMSGFVVYFGADVENFQVFRSDEPQRFVRFIAEKVAGIKIDEIVAARQEEMERARKSMETPR